MRAKLKPSEAFGVIIQKAHIPPLNGKHHDEYVARFEYMVTRDALHLYGCQFKDAEWMASHSTGPARVRFRKCVRKLQR